MLLPKWFSLSHSEWSYYLAGTSLAVGSATFAIFMIANNDGVPKINSKEDFALFAMPSSYTRTKSDNLTAREIALLKQNPQIDYTPIGSVQKNSANATQNAAPNNLSHSQIDLNDFQITSVFNDHVLLTTPMGLRMVQKGSVVAGLGRILSVESNEVGVKVTAENGILLQGAARTNP